MNTLRPVDHTDEYLERRMSAPSPDTDASAMLERLKTPVEEQAAPEGEAPVPTTPVVDISNEPSEAAVEAESSTAGNLATMLMRPFTAFGDATLAPIAKDDYEGNIVEKTGQAIATSGKAFWDALTPGYGEEMPDYGAQIVEQHMSEAPDWIKPTLSVGLSMASDPTFWGVGTAKIVQKGIQAKKMQMMTEGETVSNAGILEEGIGKLLGFSGAYNPDEITSIGKLAREMDRGNKESAKKLKGIMKDKRFIDLMEADETVAIKYETDKFDSLMGGAADAPEVVFDAEQLVPQVVMQSLRTNKAPPFIQSLNMNKLNTPEDMKRIIDMTAENIKESLTKTRADGKKRLGKLGVDFDQVEQGNLLKDLLGRETKNFDSVDAFALRQVIISTAEMVKAMGMKAKVASSFSGDGAMERAAFLKIWAVHNLAVEQATGVASEAGRLLNSFKRIATTTKGVQREVQAFMEMSVKDKRMVNMMAVFSKHLTPDQLPSALEKASRGFLNGGVDMAYEAFTNAILSGPITHATNIVSNTAMLALRPTEGYLRSISALSTGKFKEAHGQLRETNAMVVGLLGGMSDVFRMSTNSTFNALRELGGLPAKAKGAYPEGLQVRNEIAKQMIRPAITSENLMAKGKAGQVVDYIGGIIRMPGNALLKEDKAFKLINYRMTVNQEAAKNAMALGESADDVQSIYRALRNNPDEHITEKAIEMSDLYTFTNKMEGNWEKMAQLSTNSPLRWLIPFFRTPTNIMLYGARNSAPGQLYAGGKKMLFEGELPDIFKRTPQGDVSRAKFATGTMAPAAIAMYLGENITGHVDSLSPSGRFGAEFRGPEYSIKIGDDWVSYEKIEPLKSILGMMVNYKSTMQLLDPTETTYETDMTDVFAATVQPFMQTVGDNYFFEVMGNIHILLKGLGELDSDYANASENGTGIAGTGIEAGTKLLNRFAAAIAVPNLISQTNNALFEDKYRIADGLLDNIQKRLFPFSQDMPFYPNAFGEPSYLPEGVGIDVVSPFLTRPDKKDPIADRMLDLQVRVSGLPKKFHFTVAKAQQEIELSPQQRSDFGVWVGQGIPEAKGSHGIPMKKILGPMIANKRFKMAHESLQKDKIEALFKMRREAVKEYMLGTVLKAQVKELANKRVEVLRAHQRRTQQ